MLAAMNGDQPTGAKDRGFASDIDERAIDKRREFEAVRRIKDHLVVASMLCRLLLGEPGKICPPQTWARWNWRSTDGSIGPCGSRKTDTRSWWRRGTTRNRIGGAMGRVGFLGVKGDGESSRRKKSGRRTLRSSARGPVRNHGFTLWRLHPPPLLSRMNAF